MGPSIELAIVVQEEVVGKSPESWHSGWKLRHLVESAPQAYGLPPLASRN